MRRRRQRRRRSVRQGHARARNLAARSISPECRRCPEQAAGNTTAIAKRDGRRLRAVKDPSRVQNLSAREPGDPHVTRAGNAGRIGKASGYKPMMDDGGKSDGPMVPTKRPNKAATAAAEGVEGRGLTEGNTAERNAARTQCRDHAAPSELDRVRERARQDRTAKFSALLHHVTVERQRG